MKKTVSSIVALVAFLFICTRGLIQPLTKFFVWLVTLNMTQSTVSTVGEIFVKIASFAISYLSVGILFNAIGWFDSDAMKIVYFIISTIVSFALCWLVMVLETHLLLITIIAGILLVIVAALFIILSIRSKKEEMKTEV
ncbi:MAG: hypothetical protein IK090_03535 [Clostridia bacterium]|nr:hypothetical protein [Clostridia bacterium]